MVILLLVFTQLLFPHSNYYRPFTAWCLVCPPSSGSDEWPGGNAASTPWVSLSAPSSYLPSLWSSHTPCQGSPLQWLSEPHLPVTRLHFVQVSPILKKYILDCIPLKWCYYPPLFLLWQTSTFFYSVCLPQQAVCILKLFLLNHHRPPDADVCPAVIFEVVAISPFLRLSSLLGSPALCCLHSPFYFPVTSQNPLHALSPKTLVTLSCILFVRIWNLSWSCIFHLNLISIKTCACCEYCA